MTTTRVTEHEETVHFEAVVPSASGASMFTEPTGAEVGLNPLTPAPGSMNNAASRLQELGMRIRHVGTFSVSGEAPRHVWEQVFGTRVQPLSMPRSTNHPELGETRSLSNAPGQPFSLPDSLEGIVERAYPQLPPIFFGAGPSPIPPRVAYPHLRVPDDVGLVLRAPAAHKAGVTGRGVLVVMPDTGFYPHPFYEWHGYSYRATLSPDAKAIEHDEVGHGTAEAANIFALARDAEMLGVKMGDNPTLAFKTASDLLPAIISNSWGYELRGQSTLPNFLRPLETAVAQAVRDRGIVVCFSAGNGHTAFPAMMPDVIAVGGVYAEPVLDGGDFVLSASDYASSFDSMIYPGRHVPDVCGLVGRKPGGIYIMLPVEPGDAIDTQMAGGQFPNGDETVPGDGWAAISGTSAACPQIAGICALIKQVRPDLPPDLVKAVLRASARDVRTGRSAMGDEAGDGHDGATGAGLADATAAYRLAYSVQHRS